MAKKKSRTKPATKAAKKPAPKAGKKKAMKKAPASKAFDAVAARAQALKTLDFAAGITKKLVADWPADKLTHQFVPTDNHPLWTLGHLGVSNHWFANLFDGKPTAGAQYDAMFGGKSKPSPNAGDYPSLDEVMKLYDDGMARLKKTLKAPKDPLSPPKQHADWVNDTIHAAQLSVWHEGWHAGQLSSLRRAMGLPPVMS